MGGDGGFVQSDAAENELAKLPLESVGVAILQTRYGRQPRQRGGQHGVVREPEQIERRAIDLGGIAGGNGALQRGDEGRTDEIADLAVQQAGELAVLEMA